MLLNVLNYEVPCIRFHIGHLALLKVAGRCRRLASKQCQLDLLSNKLAQIWQCTFLCTAISIFVYFPVDLQQTSPSPVCPGDDVIFTCTVTVSAIESETLFLYLYDACDQHNKSVS